MDETADDDDANPYGADYVQPTRQTADHVRLIERIIAASEIVRLSEELLQAQYGDNWEEEFKLLPKGMRKVVLALEAWTRITTKLQKTKYKVDPQDKELEDQTDENIQTPQRGASIF